MRRPSQLSIPEPAIAVLAPRDFSRLDVEVFMIGRRIYDKGRSGACRSTSALSQCHQIEIRID
jgi:hypothetical protein